MPFNVLSPVGAVIEARHTVRSSIGKILSASYNGETLRQEYPPVIATFTYTTDEQGFTGAGASRNILTGSPAPGLDASVSAANGVTVTDYATCGSTFAQIFGLPDNAMVTQIRAIEHNDRVTARSNITSTQHGLALMNAGALVQTLLQRDTTAIELSHSTTGSGATYVFGVQGTPATGPYRVALYLRGTGNNILLAGQYTVNFDNVKIEVYYYTQTAARLFRAIFAGGGSVGADGQLVFNDLKAIGDPVEVNFSGNKAEGKSVIVDSHTRSNVLSEEVIRFHAAESVGSDEELPFNTTDAINSDLTARFNNQFPVGDGQALIFGTASNVSQSVSIPYGGRLLAGLGFEVRYRIYENATALETVVFSIISHITQTFNVLFNNTIPVGDPYELQFHVRGLADKAVQLIHGIRSVVWDDFKFRFRSRSYKNWIEDAQESTIYTPDADEADAWIRVNDPAPQTFTPDPDESDLWLRVNNPNPGIFIPRETE